MATVLNTLLAKKESIRVAAETEMEKIDAEVNAGGEHLGVEVSELEAWFAAKVAAVKAWI